MSWEDDFSLADKMILWAWERGDRQRREQELHEARLAAIKQREQPPEPERPKAQLNRLQQGILDVIAELREEKAKITNGVISERLIRRGIYNKQTGEAYTDVHISRTKGELREIGFNLD